MDKPMQTERTDAHVHTKFHEFISAPSFPCLAARGIAKRGSYVLGDYGSSTRPLAIDRLARDLESFTLEWDRGNDEYRTIIAIFSEEPAMTEVEFESWLWTLLNRLSRVDPGNWDPSVSSDPEAADYSWSFAGEAYYVVGLHPGASRLARRFSAPTLVFNRHRFFEELRGSGTYRKMRDLVRERDRAVSGDINPMLADFGTLSEARQYSGREVEGEWRCPWSGDVGREQKHR